MFTAYPPISYFYLSWSETLRSLWTGQIIEADTTTTLPLFAPMARCNLTSRTPNVILIHQESLFPPSIFPTVSYDHSLDSFFLSDDQTLHKLRVEIYGGGSWMSEISLLTGLSINSFGNMGAFLQVFLRGKVKETLPQVFLACGFRNQLFLAMDQTFVSMDRFYKSIGYNQIFDSKAQGSINFRERDRFYFVNALDEIERQLRLQKTPTFTYVETMASHGPYDTEYMPNEDVPGGGPGTSKEMNEYLRRLAMAKLDFEFLISEIKRRFPDQPFLIVRYGDHQPSATRPLLALTSTPDAGKFTFYAVTGVNYIVPPLPQYESLDIPFLGTVMLDAAKIPLPQSYDARKAIMKKCSGRYYGCEYRQDVLAFHGRMIHSGLIETP
jgi:phosphoglycerol transferase MdoB-like AlkP superfamily enzyme